MTDERMAISIGDADEIFEEWIVDERFVPDQPNEIGVNEGGVEYSMAGKTFYANSVSVGFSMASEINRKAGEIDIDKMYKQTDPLRCNIDIEYYISTNHFSGWRDPYLFMRDDIPGGNKTGKSFYPITIGKNIYNKCFLDNLDITISPFNPVVCRATFRSTQPPSGVPLEGLYRAQKDPRTNNQLMNSDNFVFGHTCEISGWLENITDYNGISEIGFSRSYGRKDVYCLGERTPRESLVKNVENVMRIKTTGIKEFMPTEGIRIDDDIEIIMRDASGIRMSTEPISGAGVYPLDPCMHIGSGSYVTDESYSIVGGGVVEASLTVSEAIL
jgi:hypothetical protein